MKRRRQDDQPGYARLLDAWCAPKDAGDALGCVATSFTFSPAFFEEECLSRFVGMESDPTEDGPAFLVEREEKFSQLICAAALVDQHHAKGLRSLRWDLLAARPRTGIMHAKVSMLLWSGTARLIVASANLTEDGYRRNHEVFGIIDCSIDNNRHTQLLREMVAFLRETAELAEPTTGTADPQVPNPALGRWRAFLDKVEDRLTAWESGGVAGPRSPEIRPVLVGPNRPSLFESLRGCWGNRTPPEEACVVSPFFDPPGSPNRPASEIWGSLRQRGKVAVTYALPGSHIEGSDKVQLSAPESLRRSPHGREAVISFHQLEIESHRPLHAKAYRFEGNDRLVYIMGSSNFTSPGLGLSERANIEANLAYILPSISKDPSLAKAFRQAWLRHKPVEGEVVLIPPPADDQDEAPDGTCVLPAFFVSATYGRTNEDIWVEFVLRGDSPDDWRLRADDEDDVLGDKTRWLEAGTPGVWRLPWTATRPPSGFRVEFPNRGLAAWWPANVRDASALPPPEEIRNLPLAVLIDLLTSAKPLHVALGRWLRDKRESNRAGANNHLDPLRRFDGSDLLVPRTRRIVWALASLRERLQRPVPSLEAWEWRLRGPVGVVAVAEAIAKEARTAEETAFLTAEIMLELGRVKPVSAEGGPKTADLRKQLSEVISKLRTSLEQIPLTGSETLANYVREACKTVS